MADTWQLIRDRCYREAIEAITAKFEATGDTFDLRNRATAYLLLGDHAAAASDLRFLIEHTEPRLRGDSDYILLGVCRWYDDQPPEAVFTWRQGLGMPYTDAAGGVELPALLLNAATRLKNEALERQALQLLKKHWRNFQRRAQRRKQTSEARTRHENLIHPGLAAWPGAVVPFLLGECSLEVITQSWRSAQQPVLESRWKCQADFYAGLRGLREGDKAMFRRGMEECAGSTYGELEHEFHLARWEVAHQFPDQVSVED